MTFCVSYDMVSPISNINLLLIKKNVFLVLKVNFSFLEIEDCFSYVKMANSLVILLGKALEQGMVTWIGGKCCEIVLSYLSKLVSY